MTNINKNKKGFSFIEVIIYLAIVGILLTAVVSLHLTLGGTSSKLTSSILASRNRRLSMSAIDYLIKNSDGLLKDVNGDCSDFSLDPPVLALYFANDTNLPGTCVENGGGVRISISDRKISLTCHPNMTGNGYYQNCSTSTYPAENVYYLSSSDVSIRDNYLSFSTSTSSSTANNLLAVTTNLSINSQAADNRRLAATSTATSTVIIRNNEASDLISFWKFESNPAMNVDSVGPNQLICLAGTIVSGLINGSTNGLDLEASNGNNEFCYDTSPNNLFFNNSFTITAWVKEETSGTDRDILNISDSVSKGYGFYIDNGYPMLRIGNSVAYTDYNGTGTVMSAGTVYHVAATYDFNNQKIVLYVYQKAVGGIATTTFTTAESLVNSFSTLLLFSDDTNTAGIDENFDGVVDNIRVYNRPLTAPEIWAIQSQGAT